MDLRMSLEDGTSGVTSIFFRTLRSLSVRVMYHFDVLVGLQFRVMVADFPVSIMVSVSFDLAALSEEGVAALVDANR